MITLEPGGSRLTLALRDARGAPAPGKSVTISAREPIFARERPWVRVQALYGETRIDSWLHRDDGGVQIPLLADERGEIRLFDLLPGLALEVRVEDEPGSHLFLEDRLSSPRSGELLDHVLRIPQASFALVGQVRDELGAALANVRIRLGQRARAESDADGRYRLEGLFTRTQPFVLIAELSGRVSARSEGLVLGPASTLPDLILEPGVGLRVTVVDERGEAVPVTSIWATIDGGLRFDGELLGPGRFVFSDVPPRSMGWRCTYASQTYETRHASSKGDLRWVLPVFGQPETR